jgi:hypothetical protein
LAAAAARLKKKEIFANVSEKVESLHTLRLMRPLLMVTVTMGPLPLEMEQQEEQVDEFEQRLVQKAVSMHLQQQVVSTLNNLLLQHLRRL